MSIRTLPVNPSAYDPLAGDPTVPRQIPSVLWRSQGFFNPAASMTQLLDPEQDGVVDGLLEKLERDYGRPEIARGKSLIGVSTMLRSFKMPIRKIFAIFQAYGIGRALPAKDSHDEKLKRWWEWRLLSEEAYLRWWTEMSPVFQKRWRNSFAWMWGIHDGSALQEQIDAQETLVQVTARPLVPKLVLDWIGLQLMRALLPRMPAPEAASEILAARELRLLAGESSTLFGEERETNSAMRACREMWRGEPDGLRRNVWRDITWELERSGSTPAASVPVKDAMALYSLDAGSPRVSTVEGRVNARTRGFMLARDVVNTLLPELPLVEALPIDADFVRGFQRYEEWKADSQRTPSSGWIPSARPMASVAVGAIVGGIASALSARSR